MSRAGTGSPRPPHAPRNAGSAVSMEHGVSDRSAGASAGIRRESRPLHRLVDRSRRESGREDRHDRPSQEARRPAASAGEGRRPSGKTSGTPAATITIGGTHSTSAAQAAKACTANALARGDAAQRVRRAQQARREHQPGSEKEPSIGSPGRGWPGLTNDGHRCDSDQEDGRGGRVVGARWGDQLGEDRAGDTEPCDADERPARAEVVIGRPRSRCPSTASFSRAEARHQQSAGRQPPGLGDRPARVAARRTRPSQT